MATSSTTTTSLTKRLARHLLDLDDTMSKKLLQQFEGLAEKMFEDMSTAAGEYLHDLDVREHSEDEVKAVVKKFPSALSHRNEKGRLPIHSAIWNIKSLTFVPLLAEVGDTLNVGGKGMRGGLLVVDRVNEFKNALQLFGNMSNENDTTVDSRCLDVLIKFRVSNLFWKEDIRRSILLYLYSVKSSEI